MLPILLPPISVNQSFVPSDVIPPGATPAVGTGNSVIVSVEIFNLPILLPLTSVNQRFPSGPNAIENGPAPDVGSGNSFVVAVVAAERGSAPHLGDHLASEQVDAGEDVVLAHARPAHPHREVGDPGPML